MNARLKEYVETAVKTFFGGALFFFILDIMVLNWPMGAPLFWHVLHSGLLTALLFVGNGFIADAVSISWLEYPFRRLVVSTLLTIIVTYLIGMLANWIVGLLRFGSLPADPFSLDSDYFWSLLITTFIISLFMHGRGFLLNYKASIVAQEELKRVNLASRYESLQNQVNPHFLFNSLNVLSNLVYKDADLSAKFIEQLASVYRYVLESRNKEVVSLAKEKEMLEAYLFLLQIRFGDQFKFEVDLPANPDEVIPPLTLQMLAENAIKHNVVSRKKPLSWWVSKEDGEIVVWNTLQRKHQEQTSLGIGLSNIRERYHLLSEKEILINETEEKFEVRLPVLQMQSV